MINIRHIVTGNEFRGTCATNNPMIKNNLGECNVCGKLPGEDCQKVFLSFLVSLFTFEEPITHYNKSKQQHNTTRDINNQHLFV
jgi:hypothetical protein